MNLRNNLSVIYQTSIIDPKTGAKIRENAPKRNLILDAGLDLVATKTYWDCFTACVLGDGTSPTKRDSGATTVSITSEVATASAGFFEAADVGRLLKLDSGQEIYISGYTSATEVLVAGAADDAASEFTVWYVNETGHGNELVRTSFLSGDSGDNSSTWDGTKVVHQRTFIFPVEGSARTYREIGWSNSGSVGATLFGRDLIPGGGDSISPGQQYKVTVRLQVVPSPLTQQAVADVGTGGWNTSGMQILGYLGKAFEGHSEGGVFNDDAFLEPSKGKKIRMLFTDFVLPASVSDASNSVTSGDISLNADSYVLGSFNKTWRVTFGVVSGFETTIFGMTFGGTQGADIQQALWIKFDTPQVKDSSHTLTIVMRMSWGRTLTN